MAWWACYNYYPFSQNRGSWHTGPGLATVMDLDLDDPEGKLYFEELVGWTERGMPWRIRENYGHYDPVFWNEENDSLVRSFKERRKQPEDYAQFSIGVPLI